MEKIREEEVMDVGGIGVGEGWASDSRCLR